jgi:hypothetical protein
LNSNLTLAALGRVTAACCCALASWDNFLIVQYTSSLLSPGVAMIGSVVLTSPPCVHTHNQASKQLGKAANELEPLLLMVDIFTAPPRIQKALVSPLFLQAPPLTL